ncbi:MAG: prefoldin subunit alpha [Candidatus Nanohaloarchaea archaeon]
MPEQEQQELVRRYQEIQQQVQQLQQYIETVEENISELDTTIRAVGDLEDVEEGTEILAPLGSGVMAVAELKENDRVITELGGNTREKKDTEDAVEVLETKKSDLEETKEDIEGTLQELQTQMQQVEGQLQKLQRQQQQ